MRPKLAIFAKKFYLIPLRDGLSMRNASYFETARAALSIRSATSSIRPEGEFLKIELSDQSQRDVETVR
jgi:hypothetical protein